MPYVPSEKTNPPAEDRKIIDAALVPLVKETAEEINNNLSLVKEYREIFVAVAYELDALLAGAKKTVNNKSASTEVARAIYETSKTYGYEGAHEGELNYACTMFIQLVPQEMVRTGKWKEEFRYWLYAATVKALRNAASATEHLKSEVSGVFDDVKDEFKRRVNAPYEAAQILKSGDCYFAPYYTRLVEVVDEEGHIIGHQEIMLKRSEETLHKDLLDWQIVVRKKPQK